MKLFNIMIALFAIMITGCDTPTQPTQVAEYSEFGERAIIGGCEYGVNRTAYGYAVYTHNGGCSNCWAKTQKMINEAVERITKQSSITLEKVEQSPVPVNIVTPVPMNVPTCDISNNTCFSKFNKVITVDGCQYAVCFGNGIAYTHIGNCTNCDQRMKKLFESKGNP